jgi:hypothetical protein
MNSTVARPTSGYFPEGHLRLIRVILGRCLHPLESEQVVDACTMVISCVVKSGLAHLRALGLKFHVESSPI